MFVYFWNSEIHLAVLALVFESCAGLVELIIAAWLASVRRKEKTEELERLKETLEVWFALVAAIFVFVAVGVSWRIIVLQSANEEKQLKQTQQLKSLGTAVQVASNELDNAMRQLASQSNTLAAAKIKPLKERLTDCLNQIDPNIILQLKTGQTAFPFHLMPEWKYHMLENFDSEPEAAQYLRISVIPTMEMVGGMGRAFDGTLFLDPSLVK